jgi:NTE family protein
MPEAYAVFEGGGVKGSALVGALARAEEEGLTFRGYAGTSAGSIVAALAAVGYGAAELKEVMDGVDYLAFLDGRDTLPLAELRRHKDNLKSIAPKMILFLQELRGRDWGRKWLWQNAWFVRRLANEYRAEIAQLRDASTALEGLEKGKGLYGTGTFLAWMRGLLNQRGNLDEHKKVTFRTILTDPATLRPTGKILKVVAANLEYRDAAVFNPDDTPGEEVANAVLASMSIPLFFRPYALGKNFLVDGGLLSNFPAWVFDKEKADPATDRPVLGFRLRPATTPEPAESFDQFLLALFRTKWEGIDRLQTRMVSGFVPIDIETPPEITATDFDIGAPGKQALYQAGYAAAGSALARPENRRALGLPPG